MVTGSLIQMRQNSLMVVFITLMGSAVTWASAESTMELEFVALEMAKSEAG